MNAIQESGETIPLEPAPAHLVDAPPFWPGFLFAIAATCITIGIMWDISWHETIGRDSFWTPAHMTIYLGGVLGGCVGGWLAIQSTFLGGPAARMHSVQVFGARAPLGAWLVIWGALAMLTSAPFDNWWHNAYGLDVKIISLPHSLLGLGMFGIVFGALVHLLSRQNRLRGGSGSGLFIYVGGVFLVLAGVGVMEYVFPNQQHAATFYKVAAFAFPIRLVTMARAGKISWPATRMTAVYLAVACMMVWILPLFPAQPGLAPIFNPVTHMVPPPFPLLLIFPALAVDFVLSKVYEAKGWNRLALAILIGGIFLGVFFVVQWFFSEFILSPLAENWFFVGNRVWAYGDDLGKWTTQFWKVTGSHSDSLTISSLAVAWGVAAFTSWLGLLLGGWMRKVQR